MPRLPFSPCEPTQPHCGDETVGILRAIFGPVIDQLLAGADPNAIGASTNVLATMLAYFNSGVLAVAAIIVSYTTVIGTLNTANDGEAMGKNWSSVWTPIRMVGGGSLLLTTSSGYSVIQMIVLSLALWSIGFANTIYEAGMGIGVLKPEGLVASSYQPGAYLGLRDFAKQYLGAAYCARVANAVYADPSGSPTVMADGSNPDRITKNGAREEHTYFIKDRNGTTRLGGGEPICGTVTLASYRTPATDAAQGSTDEALDALRSDLVAQKMKSLTALMGDIDRWVLMMPADITQPGWDAVRSSQLNSIVKFREDELSASIAKSLSPGGPAAHTVSQTSISFIKSLTSEGWAMASGWYQRVGQLRSKLTAIANESVGTVTAPSLSSLPSDARARVLVTSVSSVTDAIVKKAELPENGYPANAMPRPGDLASLLPSSGTADLNVGSLSNDIGKKTSVVISNIKDGLDCIMGGVNTTMQCGTNLAIGSGKDVDAVSRMKLTGDLLASYQLFFQTTRFTLNTAATAVRVMVSGAGGVQVLGTKIDGSGSVNAVWDWLQTEIISTLSTMAQYLGILGFYFSVVLPSLPYTIFMITVVGWVLGVLQTVIAAPLWATMHMRPAQTFVGSDAQGYLLLLALFVRPALAIIGLFAANLVADPIIDYIAKAFFAMRGDVVASTGWVGAISQFWTMYWWYLAFGAILLPVLYMVYGLPQVLPDQVLRWINAGVHDLGATGASGEMQRRFGPVAAAAGAGVTERLNRNGPTSTGLRSPRPPGGPGGGGGRASHVSTEERDMPVEMAQQGIYPASADGATGDHVAGFSARRSRSESPTPRSNPTSTTTPASAQSSTVIPRSYDVDNLRPTGGQKTEYADGVDSLNRSARVQATNVGSSAIHPGGQGVQESSDAATSGKEAGRRMKTELTKVDGQHATPIENGSVENASTGRPRIAQDRL